MSLRPSLLSLFFLFTACTSQSTTAPPAANAPDTESPPEEAEAETPAPPNALAEKVDAFVEAAVKKGTFSGSVLVIDGGKTVLSKGYGFAARDKEEPNGPTTIFRIGSVSKQFTAAGILVLEADGKLRLDDPVSKYIPEYPKANLEKDGVPVTIHHLLSHTGGIPAKAMSTDYLKETIWRKPIDHAAWMASISAFPLDDVPGTRWVYSNYGYTLAAMILERVSGQSYEAFMRERIFAPLGMNDTGVVVPPDKHGRYAYGYTTSKSGGELGTIMVDPSFGDPNVTWALGSGQIYSTTEDMARWDRALAEKKVTKQELLFEEVLHDYGYGWVLGERSGVSYAWHNGALTPMGFTAMIVRVPSKVRAVIFLANLERKIVTDQFEIDLEKIAVTTK